MRYANEVERRKSMYLQIAGVDMFDPPKSEQLPPISLTFKILSILKFPDREKFSFYARIVLGFSLQLFNWCANGFQNKENVVKNCPKTSLNSQ